MMPPNVWIGGGLLRHLIQHLELSGTLECLEVFDHLVALQVKFTADAVVGLVVWIGVEVYWS
jgi:hypothetical protein